MLNKKKIDQPDSITLKRISKSDQAAEIISIIQKTTVQESENENILNECNPPYERNMLLLIKIRKLGRWLIGNRMNDLKNDALR